MRVSDEPSATDISAHFGLLNSFRLSPAWDINLDLRGTLVSDDLTESRVDVVAKVCLRLRLA